MARLHVRVIVTLVLWCGCNGIINKRNGLSSYLCIICQSFTCELLSVNFGFIIHVVLFQPFIILLRLFQLVDTRCYRQNGSE